MDTRSLLLLLAVLVTVTQGDGACLVPATEPSLQTLEQGLKEVLKEVSGVECRRHVALVLDGLQNLTDWALQMADATGKVPSGVLRGNLRALGHMDECVAVEAEVQNTSMHGKYCLVSFHADADGAVVAHLLDVAMGGRRGLEYRHGLVDGGKGVLPRKTLFSPEFTRGELGVCVPAVCAPADVEAALRGLALRLRASTSLTFDLHVSEHACRTRHGPARPLGASHLAFALFCGVLAMIIIIGTILDIYSEYPNACNTSTSHAVLCAFSLRTNWKRLTSDRNEGISCMDGLRVLLSASVILIHELLYSFSEALMNRTAIHEMSLNVSPSRSIYLGNSVFFTFRGLLISYTMGDKVSRGNFKFITELLNRLIRISPTYFLLVWFYATFLEFLGDGPHWETFIQYNVDLCRKKWIFNIFYANNNDLHKCMVNSWFLTADMQLFVLALILVVPLYRWRQGRKLLIALIALSVTANAATIFAEKARVVYRFDESDQELERMVFINNMALQMYFSPFMVGMFCGYILNRIKYKTFSMNKISVIIGWSAFVMMLTYVLFGPYHMLLDSYEYNDYDAAIFASLSRLFVGVCMSWFVFACHSGYGGWINRFSCWYPFRVMSRLTFTANLSHFILILHNAGRSRAPVWVDFYSWAQIFINTFVMTMVLATILFVCIESPFSLLKQRLLNRSSSKIIQQSQEYTNNKNK